MKLRPLPPHIKRVHDAARRAFRCALSRGLVRPKPTNCERCDCEAIGRGIHGIDAHHPDYSQPLLIEWLCHWCHPDADLEQRAHDRQVPHGA